MKTTYPPIIVTQTFPVSAETVWKAITSIDEMKQWYFEVLSSFKPKVGFETRFTVSVEDRVYPHIWKVTEVIPKQKISYQWTFDGYKGKSVTHWELSEENNKTTLKLTSEVLEPYPENIPEFERESGVEGWNYFIKKTLDILFTDREI
ncbi:SRPBCC domain-containing protein [Rasiella rasia]|uniref:SRPBCC domain-containing protein n=1 Tax=Rasiella rasia TaxID=2744027 RepID=A0A6G6GHN8_9FLAO|nr:SRPBCC domain-containing protein [Rasiella rasia]QIE58062.1 SRPBCC domain-containing protein [Rasiella rasia]